MRKIVCFTFAYLLSIGAGVAYDGPKGKCYHVRDKSLLPDSMSYLTAGDVNHDIAPFDMVIYFEQAIPNTNSTDFASLPNLPEDCVNELNKIISNIKLETGGRVLLSATTNKDGKPDYNNKLSERRVNIVAPLFTEHNLEIYKFRGGQAQADVEESTVGSRAPRWRAVNIIWKNQNIAQAPDQEIQTTIEHIYHPHTSTSTVIGVQQTIDTYTTSNAQLLAERIQHLATQLDTFTFGKSHWKNKDGNFNTARLASDSIAGVVLGTAGGLITSSIIKKNQLKSGFEDIQCTIGGQVVAEYNDQFNVGIK